MVMTTGITRQPTAGPSHAELVSHEQTNRSSAFQAVDWGCVNYRPVLPCCHTAKHTGSEFEVRSLTGYVSTVPRDATAVSHMRDGLFIIIMRGAKEPSDEKVVTGGAGVKLPERVEQCGHGPDSEVLQGNANATYYLQRIGALVPEVKAYINFRDTGGVPVRNQAMCLMAHSWLSDQTPTIVRTQ